MIRSNLLAVLVLTVGCRAISEEKPSDTAGHNLEDSAQTDTAEDTDAVDTDQETDTASEDSGDTATIPDCTFELVASGNGRVEVSNELQFSLSSSSPSGSVDPAFQEVFRFNVTSLHPECGTVSVDTASFNIDASDNDGGETHWADGVRIEMVDLTVDSSAAIMSGTTEMNSGGDIYGPHSGILAIPAGETHTFAVFMDTSGASSDDMLKLVLRRYMHIVDTHESAAAVMMNDEIEGGTLEF